MPPGEERVVKSDSPRVAVVIATYNRARLLRQTLDALTRQEGVDDFEVVVVDDASTDDTWRKLEEWAAEDARLVPVRMPRNSGAAAARNIGWRAARAALIAFTDDDCTPQPGWLAALCAGLADADLVQGPTSPRPDQAGNYGPFCRTVTVEFEEGYYETCNIGYLADVLAKLGGFDETFRFPFGEDTDLAWRAKKTGARTAFVPEALVYHEVWPSRYSDYLRDIRRREGMVHLFSKHPEVRRQVGTGLWYRKGHKEALLAAGGLAVLAGNVRSPLRWLGAAGLGLRYAWVCANSRFGPRPKYKWVGVVPLAFFADLVDTAAMARASIKYRTLLL